MRGSGAAIGLVAFPIAGLILLFLKIFRVKHTFDIEEMAGIVVVMIPVLMMLGAILYCIGIAFGICRPMIKGIGCRAPWNPG
jgi:hypothetical protein